MFIFSLVRAAQSNATLIVTAPKFFLLSNFRLSYPLTSSGVKRLNGFSSFHNITKSKWTVLVSSRTLCRSFGF